MEKKESRGKREVTGMLMFAVLGCIDHPLTLVGAVAGLLIAGWNKIEWQGGKVRGKRSRTSSIRRSSSF